MHRSRTDGPPPGRVTRVFRGLVLFALLPAIALAGLILLPVVVIGRLVGLGPRGCSRRAGDAAAA